MPGPTRFAFGTAVPLALGLAASFACSDPVGPGAAAVDGLEAALSLSPGVVGRSGSFQVELTIRNTRPDTATLHSSCTTIVWTGLYLQGTRVEARGTEWGCYFVLTDFEIPPGEELRREWTVVAEDLDGNPLPRGKYTFRAEWKVGGFPDLERVLRVE